MTGEMAGKTCVITGANSGIGLETARALALIGARIVMVCRDQSKGEAAREDILRTLSQNGSPFPPAPADHLTTNSTTEITEDTETPFDTTTSPSVSSMISVVENSPAIDLVIADLSSQRSIRNAASEIKLKYDTIDVLVNNAGLIKGHRILTEDGIEWTMAVNHFAPFLLTHLLLEPLIKSSAGRVVTVSSGAHKMGKIDLDGLTCPNHYLEFKIYANSKLANILFTKELARRLSETSVTANCLHPGVVRTNFGKSGTALFHAMFLLVWPFMISPEKGARTSVYLASSPEMKGVSGEYFNRRKKARTTKRAQDMAMAKRLWELSEKTVGLGEAEQLDSVLERTDSAE